MTEQWKNIIEANNYEISNFGRVRNKTTKQILKGREKTILELRFGLGRY